MQIGIVKYIVIPFGRKDGSIILFILKQAGNNVAKKQTQARMKTIM